METVNNNKEEIQKGNRSGRFFGGMILVFIGMVFMARQLGIFYAPWLFSWPMIMVGIGLYIGARHSFRFGGWLVPVAIGVFFLADDIMYFEYRHLLWPALIIGIGLYMMVRPRRSRHFNFTPGSTTSPLSDDAIDATSVFGGTQRNIISKNFIGGRLTTVFGGTDLDFTQADINGVAVLDSTTMFGGIKLVLPAHWNFRSEVVCIAGGIEDKRQATKESVGGTKTLVLKGTCLFGGIEVKSY